MEVLIDTSVIIDIERKVIDVDNFLSDADIDRVFLSVITVSELWHGVYRAADKHIKTKRAKFVSRIVSQSSIIPIDEEIAKMHAMIWADLSKKGGLIGMNDMWIAATAHHSGLSLVTRNANEFRRVNGLNILTV